MTDEQLRKIYFPIAQSWKMIREFCDGRSAYGFEIDRNFYNRAKDEMLNFKSDGQMSIENYLGNT